MVCEIALVHEVRADLLADALLEEHVVGEHDGRAAAGLQAAVDVLEEDELLVARRVGDVVARRAAAALLRAEGRVREDDVGLRELRAARAERVAERDVALDVVEHRVHQREALHVGDELHAVEGFALLEVLLRDGEIVELVGVRLHVAVGVDEEAAGAHGGILHALAGLGLHERDHALDERARREVLAGAALGLLGVLLEQALVEIAEPLGLRAVPVERVDVLDDGAEVPRLAERRRRVGEDRLHAPRALAAEVDEELLVELEQLDAVLLDESSQR